MSTYDLYGVDTESIQLARALVEKALSLSLEERDSSYHRGPYFAYGNMGSENFELKINLDPFEDVPAEEQFSDFRFLLYVNNTTRSNTLATTLSDASRSIVLLRHEDFD
jgi:hypothetical protein